MGGHMRRSTLLAFLVCHAYAADPFPNCNGNDHSGCRGSAVQRSTTAREAVKAMASMNRPWSEVRKDLVETCGLKYQGSTSHCFEDFNHVDCCAMVDRHTHRT